MDGGLNTYGYVGGNPIQFLDSNGLTLQTNWGFFSDWVTGNGPRNRTYGPNTVETKEMKKSDGAAVIRDFFYKMGCKTRTDIAYGSLHAYEDTFYKPGDTSFQVGGFAGATAVNNGNGTVTFTIPNTAGTHSFFYHIVPDRESKTGAMSNIHQTFYWTEKIDKCRCG